MSTNEVARQLGYAAFPLVLLAGAAFIGWRMGRKRQPPSFVAWPVGVAAILLVLSFVGRHITALAFATQAQSPAPAPADQAVVLVANFLSALARNPAEAQAMLADDAQIVAGDVGGPMTAELFAAATREFARLCRRTRLERSTRPFDMPGRTILVVSGTWHCVSEERPEGHDLRVDYLVEHGRIAGVHIGAGGGANDGTRP